MASTSRTDSGALASASTSTSNSAQASSVVDQIIDDPSLIKWQAYRLRNTKTNKDYIGFVVTHRLNKKRYRPFGYQARFRQHISGSFNSHSNCVALKQALLQYGPDAFETSLLGTYDTEAEGEAVEVNFIRSYNSTYPNGYNLTYGGKKAIVRVPAAVGIEFKEPETRAPFVKRQRTDKFSAETKKKQSASNTKYLAENADARDARSKNAHSQHLAKKLTRFEGKTVGDDDAAYMVTLKPRKTGEGFCTKVRVDGIVTLFYSKKSQDEANIHAKEFLNAIRVAATATLPN